VIPELRISAANRAGVRAGGEFVLYWMISARRTRWNFALDRAAEWAVELGKPLLVLEALRCDYPWASDRHHRFVLDGMRDQARAFAGAGVGYHPYLEPTRGAGQGLLEALARSAAVVVTDEFPAFFLPRMVAAAAARLDVRLETVDSNGLLPLRATERAFHRAYDFRRFLQRTLPDHLGDFPRPKASKRGELPPFAGVPKSLAQRWPALSPESLESDLSLAPLPIDHEVAPVAERGGERAAASALGRFVDERLERYAAERNEPAAGAASELSGYLHFGHLAAHQVLDAVARHERWTPVELAESTSGARTGWWRTGPAAEAFLDQLVTWRELGYQFCRHRPGYDQFDSLPDWARKTLDEHRDDDRPHLYELDAFERAATHDPLWNAAQNELRERGRIHNYLRMLWGKKIVHWTRSPEAALRVMIELNNRYAIDGRDPNSYSGIFWVLGRFDRAWGPERPVFGKVRYMSSRNTRRKLRVDAYVERWNGGGRAR
jgi:deoxyribodipyrimidine photo-lyase